MLNRRTFLKHSLITAGAFSVSPALSAMESDTGRITRLTILHTNDTHSRMEPFPMDGGRNQGLGGVAARASLIDQIRNNQEQVLLLDAGDIFQGTPYFNLYKGEPEIRAMSAMNYDATAIGNHDFDAGMENLATQLKKHARFPMLVCNYDFTSTPMEYQTRPYHIIKKDRLRIGILGVGIELKGLVPDNLYGKTVYLDPVTRANETASRLREKEKCDFIICLSHLGYRYGDNKVSDVVLARETENIDLIIGGHTHTFMNDPLILKNRQNREVTINQVGWAGIILGRLDYEFSASGGKKLARTASLRVTKKTGE